MTRNFLMLCCLLVLSPLGAYGQEAMGQDNMKYATIQDVPIEKWQQLAEKKIYFGHQSVGYNILQGVKEIQEQNPEITLRIVETRDGSEGSGALHHSKIGSNGKPFAKIKDFQELVADNFDGQADIAFFKFCFVDMEDGADISAIFSQYKQTMADLEKKYPDTVFVHITVPLLKKEETGVLHQLKKTFRKKKKSFFDNRHNVVRNNYNKLLMEQYQNQQPFFDLARIESTDRQGQREYFTVDGKENYALVPEYTNDGGHLSGTGRAVVAEQFLIFLASLN